MVFCLTHRRYHRGQAAKMACLVSQRIDIPWEDALGRIKDMKNNSNDRNKDVREVWVMSSKEVNGEFWLANETKRFENKMKLLEGPQ